MSIDITILCENETAKRFARECRSEWGLSLFIEVGGKTILFDTGNSDLFANNAHVLKKDIDAVDFIVLSHHHWDHIGGLLQHKFTKNHNVILHPDLLTSVSKDERDIIMERFNIISSEKSFEFMQDVFFLGKIPSTNDFELQGHKGNAMNDDTALAIKTGNGTVVVTGCSHSGICNISSYSKLVTESSLYAVLGGFHLIGKNLRAVNHTIAFFKKEQPKYLFPMHCVDFPVLAKFYNEFRSKKYGVGDTIYI